MGEMLMANLSRHQVGEDSKLTAIELGKFEISRCVSVCVYKVKFLVSCFSSTLSLFAIVYGMKRKQEVLTTWFLKQEV